jgi:hypothetical protein
MLANLLAKAGNGIRLNGHIEDGREMPLHSRRLSG